jgi:hypothetical protein
VKAQQSSSGLATGPLSPAEAAFICQSTLRASQLSAAQHGPSTVHAVYCRNRKLFYIIRQKDSTVITPCRGLTDGKLPNMRAVPSTAAAAAAAHAITRDIIIRPMQHYTQVCRKSQSHQSTCQHAWGGWIPWHEQHAGDVHVSSFLVIYVSFIPTTCTMHIKNKNTPSRAAAATTHGAQQGVHI